jgi:hypothetical protein
MVGMKQKKLLTEWHLFGKKNNKQFSLLLPLDKELFDFVIRMTEAMETIAYSENMSKTEVFKNLFNN